MVRIGRLILEKEKRFLYVLSVVLNNHAFLLYQKPQQTRQHKCTLTEKKKNFIF